LNRTTLRLSRDRLSPNRSKGDYVHEGVESSASSAVDAGGESVGSPASHSSRPGVPYSLDENALALLGAPMTDWQPAVRGARRAGAARLVQLTHGAAEWIAAGAAGALCSRSEASFDRNRRPISVSPSEVNCMRSITRSGVDDAGRLQRCVSPRYVLDI